MTLTANNFTQRRVSPRRRQTQQVAKIAFAGFAVFGIMLGIVELTNDGGPSGTGRALEVVAATSMMVAFSVGVLGMAVGAVAFPSRGYWAPGDNPLPAWGRWARFATRLGIRLFWVTLTLSITVLVVAAFGRSLELLSDRIWGDGLLALPVAVTQGAVALAILASLVWFVAEMVTGIRHRRSR